MIETQTDNEMDTGMMYGSGMMIRRQRVEDLYVCFQLSWRRITPFVGFFLVVQLPE